ncbi:hypothetical protein BDW22DRAFT_524454 [Trametopsis cervina]|nr:hypothetical protein BDW22DRAFT_524454 [Trametopsis cervina]
MHTHPNSRVTMKIRGLPAALNGNGRYSRRFWSRDSLKTQLCLHGCTLPYDYCAQNNIPHRKTGKLVIAQGSQRVYIESLHCKASQLAWPTATGSPPLLDTPTLPTRLLERDERTRWSLRSLTRS